LVESYLVKLLSGRLFSKRDEFPSLTILLEIRPTGLMLWIPVLLFMRHTESHLLVYDIFISDAK
jgi:hypothetical protein